MKRPKAHQIDELAKRHFINSLPPSWVYNEQTNDYAKDYTVEIGGDGDKLGGSSFFVQLKGMAQASVNEKQGVATFSLKTHHAEYYLDQVSWTAPLCVLLLVFHGRLPSTDLIPSGSIPMPR